MRIFKSKWFERFARKNDIDNAMLIYAVERAESGLVDANLGKNVIKQRVTRSGQGKSSGYRTLIILNCGVKAFFVYGFAKNLRDNLRRDEEDSFRSMSEFLLALSDDVLVKLLKNGEFVEVDYD